MFKTKKRGNGPEAKHIAPVTKIEGIDAFDQIKKQLQASYEITKYSDADKAVLTHRLNDAVTAVEALVNELSKQIATQSQRQLLANELYLATIPNEVRIRLQTILTKKELLTVKWSLVLDLIEAEDDEKQNFEKFGFALKTVFRNIVLLAFSCYFHKFEYLVWVV